MPERSHLSIGEVLSLLREEFPDVTISKIRFLESQGLVDPERTPSGYRKFYDQDVERLRWILRQQREHFLPLKVIRGRLTEGSPSEPNGTGMHRSSTSRPDPRDKGEAAHLPGLAPPVEPVEVPEAEASPAPDVADIPTAEPRSSERENGEAPDKIRRPSAPPAAEPVGPRGEEAATGSTRVRAPEREQHTTAPKVPAEPKVAAEPAARPSRSREDSESYSAEELIGATGASTELLTELKQYGLITVHTVVAGTPYFDPTALAVTRAAVEFSRHGVEARHLRAWRNSADREAALFEQLIMPLLRQRNPQARKQAAETVEDLSRLGGDLRDALLERALKDIR